MTDTTTEIDVLRGARRLLYQFYSLALCDPHTKRWSRIIDPEFQKGAKTAADYLAEKARARKNVLAPGELGPNALDLSELLCLLKDNSVADMAKIHAVTFGLMLSKECPPYETEYNPQTFSVFRSQELADIAGFYRAFGLEPSRDFPERVDHVSLELEFMAWLFAKEQHALGGDPALQKERVEICRDAQDRFFAQHVMWWIPAFAHALRKKVTDSGFYAVLARSLAAFIAAERGMRELAVPTVLLSPKPTEEASAGCNECADGT